MLWRDYYYKIPYKNFYTIVTPNEQQNYVLVSFFISIIYFALNGFQLTLSLSFFIFSFVSFLYYPLLLRIAYGSKKISVYLNYKSYHLALNQEALHKTHKKYKSSNIFFFTSKKHDFSKEVEEKIAYIEALEINFINKSRYQPYINIAYHASIVFIFSSLSISSLIFFIDSSSIKFPNLLFIFSILFIINVINQGHQIFIDLYARLYYRELKKKILKSNKYINFKKNYTIEKKDNNDEVGRNSTDSVGVIIGVLFSVYVTLIFNKIYPVQTESKIIIDRNVTHYIKNNIEEKRKAKIDIDINVTQHINKFFIEKGK